MTYLGQVRRLRRLAEAALGKYELVFPRLRFITHIENTTFRVDTDPADPAGSGPYVPGRYLLRIHRIGYHSDEAIRSELRWLEALRREGLGVPEPVPGRSGELLVRAGAPGIEGERTCTLLRWLGGRMRRRTLRPKDLERLGSLMARLHRQAACWHPPAEFSRIHWNREALFHGAGTVSRQEARSWERLPPEDRELLEEVERRAGPILDRLFRTQGAVGLVHADLHFGNVLFTREELRPIDFDDCGFAPWIYDFAVLGNDLRDRPDWPAWRDAMLRGYERIRPLPRGQWEHLETLMISRRVSVCLWFLAQAEHNPWFTARQERFLPWILQGARRYLA